MTVQTEEPSTPYKTFPIMEVDTEQLKQDDVPKKKLFELRNDATNRSINIFKVTGMLISLFIGIVGVTIFLTERNCYGLLHSVVLQFVCIPLLRLNYYYYNGTLQLRTGVPNLRECKIISGILFIICFIAGVSEIYLGIFYEQGFEIGHDGHFASSVPAWLACIWSLVLCLDCRKFIVIVSSFKLIAFPVESLPAGLNIV